MASAKGAGSTKSTTLGLLWGFLHIVGTRSRKSSKSKGALEMASAKGADSTKSTTFGLLWCSLVFLPFRRAQKPDSQQIQRGFAKGAASTKSTAFGLLWGSFPPFRRSKKPEIQQIRRGLGNGFRKRSGLHKTDNFWTLVGFPPFRRSQKPEIQQIRRGLGHGLLYEIDPSISAVPEAGNPANPKGPWKWLPQKERAVQNR